MNKNVRIAKELVKLAKSLMAAPADGEEDFDESELKKLVGDIDSAADKATSQADSAADDMEELAQAAQEEVENAEAVFKRNLRYAKRYYSTNFTASDRRIYKANVLAEDVRKASIKVAKYLKKAKMRMADFSEGFNKNRRPMIDATKSAIKNAIQFLVDKINAFIDWVTKTVEKAKQAGKTALGAIGKGALIAATAAIIAIIAPVALAVYGIVKVFGIAKGEVLKIFDELKKAFTALKDAVAKGLDAITTALGVIANVATVIPKAIQELVVEAAEGFINDKEEELQ